MTQLSQLLPRNSTPLERALADAMAARVDPGVIARYHNPDTCPTELLPWLAWEAHVDGWDTAVTESQQRALIRNSWDLHKYKGTPWAVLTALAAIGYPRARLAEWWEHTPPGRPGTFRVTLPWQPALSDAAEWARLRAAVTAYKNVRSWPEWATVIVPTDDPDALPDDPDAWPTPTLQTYARASLTTLARYNAPTPAGAAAIPHARAAAGLIARPALAAGQLGAAASAGAGAVVIARLGALPPDDWRTWSAVSLRRALRAVHSTGGAACVRVRYHAAPASTATQPAPRLAAALICRYAPAAGQLGAAASAGAGAAVIARLGALPPDSWRTWSAVSLRRALRAAHSTGGAAGVRVRYHAAAPAAATLQVAARYGIGVALVTRLGQPAKFDAWRPILLTDDGGPLLTDDGGAIEL